MVVAPGPQAQRRVQTYTVKTLTGRTLPRVLLLWKQLAPTLFTLVIALSCPCAAVALQSVQLAWDPSPDATTAGYIVHYGTVSGSPSQHLDVGMQTTGRVLNLVEGVTYYFSVTAYTASRVESEPSNEIAYQVPPLPVGTLHWEGGAAPVTAPRLRVTLEPGRQFEIQASEDLRDWTTIHTAISPANGVTDFVDLEGAQRPRRFYRLATVSRTLAGALSIEPLSSGNARVRMYYSVRSGVPFKLQASRDLRTWSTISMGVSTTETWRPFEDPASALLPRRFYRLNYP